MNSLFSMMASLAAKACVGGSGTLHNDSFFKCSKVRKNSYNDILKIIKILYLLSIMGVSTFVRLNADNFTIIRSPKGYSKPCTFSLKEYKNYIATMLTTTR